MDTPLSVLVVSPDRRFRSVTTVLIARRGCAVATTAHAGRLVELGERLDVDVIVIDLDEGSSASVAAVDDALGLVGDVGLVLVDEDGAAARAHGPLAQVHCKWGPFEVLYAAIETAGRQRRSRPVGSEREVA